MHTCAKCVGGEADAGGGLAWQVALQRAGFISRNMQVEICQARYQPRVPRHASLGDRKRGRVVCDPVLLLWF